MTTRDKNSVSNTILWVSIRTFINVMLLFVLVEAFILGYQFSYKLFNDNPYMAASKTTMNITIEEGTSVADVAMILDNNEIVDGKYLFMARVYLGKYHNRIQAGTYVLGPGMSPDEICRTICGIKSEDAS